MPFADALKVEGFLASTPEILHTISHNPDLSFIYNDPHSSPMSRYNVSIWSFDGSDLLWWYNTTSSVASGSEITVTYNTEPYPTNGPVLEDGVSYKLEVSVANLSGIWSSVSEIDFHMNEVLQPVAPLSPVDDGIILATQNQTVSWASPGNDAEGDNPSSFSWKVSTDPSFSNIIESGSGLIMESGEFNTTPSGNFYWRVNMTDGWETSSYGNQPDGYWHFTTYSPGANSPPTITNKDSAPSKATVNSELSFTFTATDPDSDMLSWSRLSGPGWLNIGQSNGTIYGTPASLDFGSNEYTIRVSDGKGGIDNHTFTIEVEDVQDDDEQDDDGISFLPWLIILIIIIVVLIILLIISRRKKSDEDETKEPDTERKS